MFYIDISKYEFSVSESLIEELEQIDVALLGFKEDGERNKDFNMIACDLVDEVLAYASFDDSVVEMCWRHCVTYWRDQFEFPLIRTWIDEDTSREKGEEYA